MKKSIVFGVMAFSLLPQASVASSVAEDLTGVVDGLSSLIRGNTAGFVDGIVGAVPLVGLFAIVFGITFFLTKTTIFKKEDQAKYARMVSIGIALIGLVQQSVYNVILNLSKSFLILAFIFAIVMMAIMFVNVNRKSYFEVQKDTFDAMNNKLGSQKTLQKTKDDFLKDKKYYERSRNELRRLDGEIREMNKLGGDEIRAVDKLIDMVTRAHSAAAEGAADKIHTYTKAITAGISGLVTSMKHEHKHLHKIDYLLNDIQSITKRWGKDESEEENEEKRLEKIFQHYNKHHAGDKLRELHKVQGDLRGLKDHLRELHKALRNARHMEHRLIHLKDKLSGHAVKQKHEMAEHARSAILDGDFKSAHSKLDNLRYIISHQKELFGELHEEERALRQLLSHMDHHERAAIRLVKDMASKTS
ncbi:MAG: hypothetical protein ACLFTH_01950 [Candidatus Woesearchaeota archaeon]